MTKKQKNNKKIDMAEFGIDSRYSSKKERLSESKALMKARLDRMENFSEGQIITAKLLQLKFKMEEFLKQSECENQNHFTSFLKLYIDTIYSKRIYFAKDIDVPAVLLSQVLNNHREPKEDFFLKLMIHSGMVYKNISRFSEETWYKVYFHEKICETMSKQDEWRPSIEKHVELSRRIIA